VNIANTERLRREAHMHQTVCECGDPTCPAVGYFYVTVVNDGGEYRRLLGPFGTHAEALASVPIAKDIANRLDARAHWYAYGTARTESAGASLFVPCLHCGELKHFLACRCTRRES
jgi:hypothetical protein